ncbi:hypothetical protein PROVRUST_05318 [Providencia rustigianii DSM 4541]|uniref:Uncharacterized protein n=1 Tax=Providencia rustigianii DSM 4541 TaxID=500637 RepID=D1NZG4_9GAMM|nr:hypothetical protein PROVRUST_05318 [Providencia rustigianii DSM 4541]
MRKLPVFRCVFIGGNKGVVHQTISMVILLKLDSHNDVYFDEFCYLNSEHDFV